MTWMAIFCIMALTVANVRERIAISEKEMKIEAREREADEAKMRKVAEEWPGTWQNLLKDPIVKRHMENEAGARRQTARNFLRWRDRDMAKARVEARERAAARQRRRVQNEKRPCEITFFRATEMVRQE